MELRLHVSSFALLAFVISVSGSEQRTAAKTGHTRSYSFIHGT